MTTPRNSAPPRRARLEFDIADGHAAFTRDARRGRMTVRYPDGHTVTIEMKED